jgi:hypothetical protein
MRKGTAPVGAAAVGHRWFLRWEEAVKGGWCLAAVGKRGREVEGKIKGAAVETKGGGAAVFGLKELSSWLAGRKEI